MNNHIGGKSGFQVFDSSEQAQGVISHVPDGSIAVCAKQATYSPCRVTVVDMESQPSTARSVAATNGADTTLSSKHLVVLLVGDVEGFHQPSIARATIGNKPRARLAHLLRIACVPSHSRLLPATVAAGRADHLAIPLKAKALGRKGFLAEATSLHGGML